MSPVAAGNAGNPGGASSDALADELPEPLAGLAGGATWTPVRVTPLGTTAWRLTGPNRTFRLDVAPAGPEGDRLGHQRDRLDWLARALPSGPEGDPVRARPSVPTVLAAAVDADSGDTYLATTVVPGTPADGEEHRGDVDELLAGLVDGLRAVHALPVASCPFRTTVDDLLARAATRVDAGQVDAAALSPPYRRYAPARLLELAVAGRPATADDPADLVVTQGRPTLGNTLVERGRVTGYADWSRLAVADRYLDLALITRDLAARVSPHALGPFVDAYGISTPDLLKLDFFVLLAELLG